MKKLHIDIETYSSVNIRKAGAYKYIESPDFEIILIAYAFDDGPIKIIDLAQTNQEHPLVLIGALNDPNIEKHAHNATFERKAFEKQGLKTPASFWHSYMVKAAY